jgi:hypothetical protein
MHSALEIAKGSIIGSNGKRGGHGRSRAGWWAQATFTSMMAGYRGRIERAVRGQAKGGSSAGNGKLEIKAATVKRIGSAQNEGV